MLAETVRMARRRSPPKRFCNAGHGRLHVNGRPTSWSVLATTLVLNPRHDTAFVQLAESLAEDADEPTVLEERLRTKYPDVVVRARDLADESFTVWYVYRDGHWIPAPDRAP